MIRTDPFQVLDRLVRLSGGAQASMPMDSYRSGDEFVVALDLPGVDPGQIDLDVERHVLTVKAERRPLGDDVQPVISERPTGVFSRRLFLGEGLDTERIEAEYAEGVLVLRIPVADQAKPRKIEVTTADQKQLST
ncbi:Hsp20/alpha crystallin family protein [Kribbella deserti]|uniref:Hsp20/alpha crystallin family protein n=1 Tax=Kribbella deserti TaxID=1926257 RepID=A0ABV6QG83_9ACTN